jgi:hypothetical protein
VPQRVTVCSLLSVCVKVPQSAKATGRILAGERPTILKKAGLGYQLQSTDKPAQIFIIATAHPRPLSTLHCPLFPTWDPIWRRPPQSFLPGRAPHRPRPPRRPHLQCRCPPRRCRWRLSWPRHSCVRIRCVRIRCARIGCVRIISSEKTSRTNKVKGSRFGTQGVIGLGSGSGLDK